MLNNNAIEIIETIKSSKNILINMDTRTDYDAICSTTVIHKFITKLGINSHIIHSHKIGVIFEGFFDHSNIQTETDIATVNLEDYDLVIFLDSGEHTHVSEKEDFKIPTTIKSINIDHHITNDFFGNLNYVKHLGSCCSVLYHLLKELNVDIPVEWMEILTVGLLTDTGFFMFDSVTPEDLRIAAEFLEKGTKVWNISAKLSKFEYIDQIRLRQIVYTNLFINHEKKYAYSTISNKEIAEHNIDLTKVYLSESDMIKFLVGVDFVFVINENYDFPGNYEISFRSKDPHNNVANMALQFGGGGHITAAGAKLENINSMQEALNKVITTLNL